MGNDIKAEITFVQNDLPGLMAGKYRLQIEQNISKNDLIISENDLATEYKFSVTGDRFKLNDQDVVYSMFPPNFAVGRYNTVLPSIVLTKTTLPWQRSPLSSGKSNTIINDIPTWLTILIFDENDVQEYINDFPYFNLESKTATVADLFKPSECKESSLGSNYSYFDTIPGGSNPVNYLEPGQQLSDIIQIIDIPLPLFQKIAPKVDDLKYMAHIRKVSLLNKATMPGISDKGESERSFSVVFGNRLPDSGVKTCAYLVSLENMSQMLLSDDKISNTKKSVRLAVLKSWSFYSTDSNASFNQTLMQLDCSALSLLKKEDNLDKTLNKDLIQKIEKSLNHLWHSSYRQLDFFMLERTILEFFNEISLLKEWEISKYLEYFAISHGLPFSKRKGTVVIEKEATAGFEAKTPAVLHIFLPETEYLTSIFGISGEWINAYDTSWNTGIAAIMALIASNDIRHGPITACINLNWAEDDTLNDIIFPVLTMGYVPLNHHLRSNYKERDKYMGEKTVSWFRGPLTPYLIDSDRVELPASSADELMIFDPTMGMFDVSYSSAWTLGRQICLRNKNLSYKLFNWRKQLINKIRQKVEQEYVCNHFGIKPKEGQSILKTSLMSLKNKK